jgi:cellulose synthase operon protein C
MIPPMALLDGELLLARREPEAAIAPFESALAGGIGSRAVAGLYQARLQAGRPDALRTLEDALAANPQDTVVRVLAADQNLSQGNYEDAIRHYEVLTQAQPDNAALLNNLAWLYNRKGDARALATAERALEFAPESAHVMDTLGWILHQRGDNARALELISKAAGLAPDVAEIRYHHAVLLAETGDKRARPARRAPCWRTKPP